MKERPIVIRKWPILGTVSLIGIMGNGVSFFLTLTSGTLHQVNIWDVPATADQMWNAAHNCTWPIAGGVRAWSSFLQGTKGQVERRFITHCKGV